MQLLTVRMLQTAGGFPLPDDFLNIEYLKIVPSVVALTREGYVSENGGAPPPPQGQQAVLGHSRADAGPQLAVGQPAGLHLGPDQLQRADHRHSAHCNTHTHTCWKSKHSHCAHVYL